MTNDPIVQEVHKARQRLLDESGGSFRKYVERIRAHEERHPDRLVTKDQLHKRPNGAPIVAQSRKQSASNAKNR
jgi:hypothetical protein